jgi:hypothetical protein
MQDVGQTEHAAHHVLSFAQAHFAAPSSERRKLMSAPLSTELKNKHQVLQRVMHFHQQQKPGADQECAAGPGCPNP